MVLLLAPPSALHASDADEPAAIYHGQGSGRNQIAIAKDRRLSAWEKPYALEVRNTDGTEESS